MENLVLVVHLLVALAIIGLILLQQGKGAEMGASFGAGASQTLFGSSGSGNFFSRMTAILALVFFITSVGLAMMAKQRTGEVDDLPSGFESLQTEASESTEMSDVPVVDEIPESDAADLPVIDAEDVDSAEDVELEAPEVPETQE